jgi:hypothetical protein
MGDDGEYQVPAPWQAGLSNVSLPFIILGSDAHNQRDREPIVVRSLVFLSMVGSQNDLVIAILSWPALSV